MRTNTFFEGEGMGGEPPSQGVGSMGGSERPRARHAPSPPSGVPPPLGPPPDRSGLIGGGPTTGGGGMGGGMRAGYGGGGMGGMPRSIPGMAEDDDNYGASPFHLKHMPILGRSWQR